MHPKYGWSGTVSREFPLIALIALGAFFHSTPGSAHFQGKKKHININKFAGLSRDWAGAKILFMCFFFGSFLMGEKKHINKIPPKIPGQSRENFVYVFFLYVFFSLPTFLDSFQICVQILPAMLPWSPFLFFFRFLCSLGVISPYAFCVVKIGSAPQYCWEFHDRLWEALSGTIPEKRGVPSRTEGERILEMLRTPQMPWIIGLGASQPYSRREFQETFWERFPGSCRNFFRKVPGVLGEWPRRRLSGGQKAQLWW